MSDNEISATDAGTVFGVCVDGESVAVCELTSRGQREMLKGGSPELWDEWSEWFPLEKLPEELSVRVPS